MDYPDTLATLRTQDTGRRQKKTKENTTQTIKKMRNTQSSIRMRVNPGCREE
jgi:hypothetical protein